MQSERLRFDRIMCMTENSIKHLIILVN